MIGKIFSETLNHILIVLLRIEAFSMREKSLSLYIV